jgi:hypothetical protein
MDPVHVRLGPNAPARERRLAALLEGRDPRDPALMAVLEEAEIAGTLGLAGRAGPEEAARVSRAIHAVAEDAPLTVEALRAWHEALTGETGLRAVHRDRPGAPPGAPPELIAGRLAVLEQWIGGDSGRQLRPAEQAALAFARVMEILPFATGNGRVARLAAAHLMARAGARRPLLVAADRPRLEAATVAAFQLHTLPLVELLAEAEGRAADLMIAFLSGDRPDR